MPTASKDLIFELKNLNEDRIPLEESEDYVVESRRPSNLYRKTKNWQQWTAHWILILLTLLGFTALIAILLFLKTVITEE
ncbi:unnamed protein product [Bursaphelenchus okinawaensis]|uniref:Uncharacterized protein n=1 Tax=Bursaphelenchus okinawaensis TaxID=465554 RepID=A0A811K2D8_9BILA|nr:unnamed protein product [Bursaphelenchus okinawaensis]CAG9090487.1 unnamed protein product [Bursaphelenchus okinawaensis]